MDRNKESLAVLPLSGIPSPKKHRLRAIFRSASLIVLVCGFLAYNHFFDNLSKPAGLFKTENKFEANFQESTYNHRRLVEELSPQDEVNTITERFMHFYRDLQETNTTATDDLVLEESCGHKAQSWYELMGCIVGVLYLFFAIAIVVDELFVPALEEMSSERHMNLSMDVAGATLMAAGGSAPELFTSLFSTFQESDVGFGTIVGSAIFNILFVIACVCLLSKEVLTLTWWPLFRDCTYYVISLILLAIFMGVNSAGEIYWWEAAILFAMYFGYVLVMKYNAKLYQILTKKSYEELMESAARPASALMSEKDPDGNASIVSMHTVRSFAWPSTFRAGVLKLLRNPSSWVDTAGVGIVSKISGDVNDTFRTIDKDNDGCLSKEEMERLFMELDCPISEEELNEVMNILDIDKDGKISKWEFTKWYIKSEERVRSRLRHIFDMFDDNNSGTIERSELKHVLEQLEPNITDNDVAAALKEMYQEGSTEEITFKEFSDWYKKSILYDKHQEVLESAEEGLSLAPPLGEGCWAVFFWAFSFPIVLTLKFTVPDVRKPGMGKFCYASFVLSIGWIGVYSYFMVEWAGIIGRTIGIPDVVMGLTFLAAGTSVPDLLSSVIVAKRGEGDMAVSSSVGSNIFDILVGLPFPWLCFTLWNNGKDFVTVEAKGLAISIVILLVMVIAIVLTIHCSGWKLTKKVAFVMFVLYFAFLAQSIVQELPLTVC